VRFAGRAHSALQTESMNPTNPGRVDTAHAGGIARVRFFHPQSNSLPGRLLAGLAAAVTAAGRRDDTQVIVIESEGDKAFCAGASFDELLAIDDAEKGRAFFTGFADVINAIRTAPCFVVARVQGRTVGGGVGLAAAADYCLALDTAAVKLSELAVGIGPFVVGPAVERKIGRAAFAELAIHATRWKSAQWAREKGLYAELFATREELDGATDGLARQLAQSNPAAMRQLKTIFWEGTGHWDQLLAERAAVSGQLVLSDFARNAMAAFRKK
jgi:methylglutaconyl-CoA hydratase